MNRSISKATAACLMALLTATQGCAPRKPPPLAADVRASLGTVGVYSVGPSVEGSLAAPVGVGKQGVKGAAKGGGIGLLSGAGGGAILGLFTGPFAPIFVPVFAAAGAVGGVVLGSGIGAVSHGLTAIPTASANDIQTALTAALAGRDLQADVRRRVVDGGPGDRIDLGGSDAAVPSPAPDYRQFAEQGAQAVLEIGIVDVGLRGKGGTDPQLTLVIDGRARLISLPDNRVLWSNERITFESSRTTFSEWTADDSRLLRSEIDHGLETLTERIGSDVLPRG